MSRSGLLAQAGNVEARRKGRCVGDEPPIDAAYCREGVDFPNEEDRTYDSKSELITSMSVKKKKNTVSGSLAS